MINKNAVISIAKKEITSQTAGFRISVQNVGRPLTILIQFDDFHRKVI